MIAATDSPPQRPSTTTVEQNLRTASQRRINLIWEYTQAAIALLTVTSNIAYVFIGLFVPASVVATSSAELLKNAFFLVIGFYFGRTNHARIGDEPRSGRSSDSLDDR